MMWVEKWRPKKLADFIGSEDIKSTIGDMVKTPLDLPHILFVSRSPGTGKTTMAKIVTNEIGTRDVLMLNSSDERKLEHIRGKVKDFAMTLRSDKKIPKVIIMDEADGMRVESQEALRTIIEKYHTNCKFILTANDEGGLIEPIRSRCTVIRMRDTPKDDICDRLAMICDKEGKKHEAEGIRKVVDTYYPDMRSMINVLQKSKEVSTKLVEAITGLEDSYYNLLKTGTPYEIRKFVIENNINVVSMLKVVKNKILDDNSLKTIEDWQEKIAKIGFEIAEVDYRMRVGADPEIQLNAFAFAFINTFRKGRWN